MRGPGGPGPEHFHDDRRGPPGEGPR
jgi:hypothetical protein